MAKAKIMIVEDEIIVAEALSMAFSYWGYEMCKPVFSGEEAIRKVGEEKPDIVLMDINMPGEIDGIEFARHIRSLFGTPVVFLTGHMDEETRGRADSIEHNGYLIKPAESEEIKSACDKALLNNPATKFGLTST